MLLLNFIVYFIDILPPSLTSSCSFNELCNGKKSYVLDDDCLVDLNSIAVNKVVTKLCNHVGDILTQIEEKLGSISKYYIGLTGISREAGCRSISHMNPKTVKTSTISNEWKKGVQDSYGKDGLVVFAIITKDVLPNDWPSTINKQEYALVSNQMLLHHLLLFSPDQRLINDTFVVNFAKRDSAFALYVAFSL